ncbi:hypothetical protein LP419_25045 [Massilia sp. H-1]|nr:hypothetical protein LP419_25045 [Massilia sp. H-1]
MKSTHPATAHDYASPEIAFAESSLGEALLKLLAEGSVSNRAIADFLLRNQVRVTALGIEELAENCQVSTATISRFARELGFRNYAAMRNEIATTLQSVLQPVDKLRNNIARRAMPPPLRQSRAWSMPRPMSRRPGRRSTCPNWTVSWPA